jgi:hypothetical protein
VRAVGEVDELRLQLARAEDALSAAADAIDALSKRTGRRLRRESPYLTARWLRGQAVDAHEVLMDTTPPPRVRRA